MDYFYVSKEKWTEYLKKLLSEYQLYAPVKKDNSVDYEEIVEDRIDSIYYQGNTPTTPLKAFYLPVKENVINITETNPRIVIGVPNCDLWGLDMLDNIYLDDEFTDICYQRNRDRTIVFGKDCYQYKETCHCTAYSISPFAEKNCDVSMSVIDDMFYLTPFSDKGRDLLESLKISDNESSDSIPAQIAAKRDEITAKLKEQNKSIPDEIESRKGIEKDNEELWKKFSSTCVSCGACSFICPTCHCFLLIDRDNFEKIKNWDVCQYPGFALVAAGEDPLKKLHERFRYRYLCKFSYKPDMFKAIGCTGCGRCIDCCIGKIDKNEVIVEACK